MRPIDADALINWLDTEIDTEEWLSKPLQTGFKYKTWVGITPLPTNSIIIDSKLSIVDEDGSPMT